MEVMEESVLRVDENSVRNSVIGVLGWRLSQHREDPWSTVVSDARDCSSRP